ncbi:MAG: lipoprotein-releasing system transmembrane subunit LolC, partial [Nitrospirae bacterium]
MKLSYEFFIALRYLKSRKKHRGISFNTFVSIAGICLGVMALIVVLGVMTGAHEDMRNKILGVNAHLVVLNFAGGIENYDLVISKIERTEGVTAAAPFVLGQVMIARGKTAHGVYMRGVDPKYEEKVTILKEKIKEGSFEALKEKAPK